MLRKCCQKIINALFALCIGFGLESEVCASSSAAAAATAASAASPSVELYSSDNCTWCVSLKNLFLEKKIPFVEYNVVKHPQHYAELKRRGFKTVPQVFVKGQHIGGYMALAWVSDEELRAKTAQTADVQKATLRN